MRSLHVLLIYKLNEFNRHIWSSTITLSPIQLDQLIFCETSKRVYLVLVIFHIEFQLNCCPFLFAPCSLPPNIDAYLLCVFFFLSLICFIFLCLVTAICYFISFISVGKCRFLYRFQCVNSWMELYGTFATK